MRRAAAVAAGALVCVPAAWAAPPILLPSPARPPSGVPPLGSTTGRVEVRWRGRIASSERVLVSLDGTGAPREVRVVQRLRLPAVGDYVLQVPAPALDVRAAPGSDADPGLRAGAVLWQGFSQGGEVLAADVTLRTAEASRYLPVQVRVSRDGAASRVRIENATGANATLPTGEGRPAELRRILASLARSGSRDVFAHVDGPVGARTVRIEAPLRVEGSAGGVRFSATLGARRPLVLTLRVPGAHPPSLRLTVRPVLPPALLSIPPGVDGTRALELASETLARAGRAAQYREFLANPDPRGASEAVYELRTATAARAGIPAGEGGSGLGLAGSVLVALAAAGALAGAAALWARS